MAAKEKRKAEINNLKEKRKEEVVVAAISIFKERGIDQTKMTDIAEKAEVGIASVYRYFQTKFDLVIAAATWLWQEEISALVNQFYYPEFEKLSGVQQVREVLNIFITIYLDYPQYMSFLEYFDNYIVKEEVLAEKLESYEQSIMDLKAGLFNAIERGKKDGSIKESLESNNFYITITHALMSLSQKLILRGTILKSDYEVQGEEQLRMLIEMAMDHIRKR